MEQIRKIEKLNENVEIKMVKQASVINAFSKLDWEIKRRGHHLKEIKKGHTIPIPTKHCNENRILIYPITRCIGDIEKQYKRNKLLTWKPLLIFTLAPT